MVKVSNDCVNKKNKKVRVKSKKTIFDRILTKLSKKKKKDIKKKKGFTLIELLAVIVILGLLMAIAIPSVTRYINHSKKKTLNTTIGNFISALGIDVNDFSYSFTSPETLYAVPIECIDLERGGKDPFGKWEPALHEHWAYVLVYYDEESSSYSYGFTFKDEAGYGLLPTIVDNIDKSDIKTGLDLVKPNPYITHNADGTLDSADYLKYFNENLFPEITDADDYKFNDVKTLLGVKNGDGKTTCTILREEEYYFANILGDVNVDGKITCDDYYIFENVAFGTNCIGDKSIQFSTQANTKDLYYVKDGKKQLLASRHNADYDGNNRIEVTDTSGLQSVFSSNFGIKCEEKESHFYCREYSYDASGNITETLCINDCTLE